MHSERAARAVGWSCDIRIAADNAVFRAGDAYLGLVPSWGMGLTRLPRLVGHNRLNRALDILLLGENFSAATALDLGLVTRVVPKERLQAEARSVAERITRASPQAILATRRAVNFNVRHSWDEMVRYEQEICREVFAHPDAAEGPLAFMDMKRSREISGSRGRLGDPGGAGGRICEGDIGEGYADVYGERAGLGHGPRHCRATGTRREARALVLRRGSD